MIALLIVPHVASFCFRAEQEVLLRRCSVYSDDKMKIRHSFFRRSKKGSHGYSISHSRESSDSRGDEAGSSIGSSTAAFLNGMFDTCGPTSVTKFTYIHTTRICVASSAK